MNNLLSSLILFCCLTIVAIPDSTAQLKHLKNKLSTKKHDLTRGDRASILKVKNEDAYYKFKEVQKQFKRLDKALKDGNAKNARDQMSYIRKNLDFIAEKAPKFSLLPEEERYAASKKVYEETYGKLIEKVEEVKPDKQKS